MGPCHGEPHPRSDLWLDPQMGKGRAGLIQMMVLWVPPPCAPPLCPSGPQTHPTRMPLELRMRPTSTSRQMATSSSSRPR